MYVHQEGVPIQATNDEVTTDCNCWILQRRHAVQEGVPWWI